MAANKVGGCLDCFEPLPLGLDLTHILSGWPLSSPGTVFILYPELLPAAPQEFTKQGGSHGIALVRWIWRASYPGPGPAQHARPSPSPVWKSRTWKSGSLESKQLPSIKLIRIKIRVAQSVGKSGLV